MKTNNLKWIRLMPILCCFFLVNCEKDNNLEGIEKVGNKRFKKISLQDMNSRVVHDGNYEAFSRMLDGNKGAASSSQRTVALDNAVILTDEIVVIESDEGSDYTFKVLANSEGNEFYNLVLETNVNGVIIDDKFIKYTPSESWMQDPSQPFSGTVSSSESDTFSVDDINFRLGRCVTNISYEWSCNAGNEHAPDTCWAGGSDLIVQVTYGACPEGGEEESIDTPDGDGNASGGGYSGGTETTPLPPCPLVIGGVYGNDCLDPDEYNLALELNAAGVDDYEIDVNNDIDPNSVPNFSTVDELINYVESFVGQEASNVQQQTTTTSFSFVMNSILGTDLSFTVQKSVPTPTAPLDILSVTSELIGITAFQHWEQDEEFGEYVTGGSVMNITMTGIYKRGAMVNGDGLFITTKYHFSARFNYSTGEYVGASIYNIEY